MEGQIAGRSLLGQIPAETAKVAVDTGIIDIDSKWRQSVGEITPDYQDVLFKKGFRGIIDTCREKMAQLKLSQPDALKNTISTAPSSCAAKV